jgi:hypothetical protein
MIAVRNGRTPPTSRRAASLWHAWASWRCDAFKVICNILPGKHWLFPSKLPGNIAVLSKRTRARRRIRRVEGDAQPLELMVIPRHASLVLVSGHCALIYNLVANPFGMDTGTAVRLVHRPGGNGYRAAPLSCTTNITANPYGRGRGWQSSMTAPPSSA